MKRTFALLLLLFGLMSCSLLERNDPNPEPQNSAPTVTLNASTLSGTAPLSITFTANASDPDGDALSYTWSIAGAADAPTASQTFNEAGSYPVTVTVSDGKLGASADVNIAVTGGDTEPNPDPDPNPEPDITLSVTASPGGPVPWGVTYEVKTNGEVPDGSTLSVTCAEQPAVDLGTLEAFKVENVFSCIHVAVDEKITVTLKAKDGTVLSQKEQAADVQLTAGVPFGGAWEYSGQYGDTFYESATFEITQAVDSVTGRGEGSRELEGSDPDPTTFTLSAKTSELAMKAPATEVITNPLDRVLVFVGAYAAEIPGVIPSPDGNHQQVFYAPNTQSLDSNDGYLYTVQ